MVIRASIKAAAFVAAVAMYIAACTSAYAAIVTGSSGSLAASVTFALSEDGSVLTVTLKNTSTSDVFVPSEVLTAVFFDTDPTVNLKPSTATASGVVFGPASVDVRGEWAYRGDLGSPARFGISSAGFGLFGPKDVFGGSNLQGPASPDGLQYGITSLGDNLTTGNQAVSGGNALIQDAVVFTFTGATGLTDQSFKNITFQYGTALTETSYIGDHTPITEMPPAVPEAPTIIAGALLLLPFGASTIRILRRRAKAQRNDGVEFQ